MRLCDLRRRRMRQEPRVRPRLFMGICGEVWYNGSVRNSVWRTIFAYKYDIRGDNDTVRLIRSLSFVLAD